MASANLQCWPFDADRLPRSFEIVCPQCLLMTGISTLVPKVPSVYLLLSESPRRMNFIVYNESNKRKNLTSIALQSLEGSLLLMAQSSVCG